MGLDHGYALSVDCRSWERSFWGSWGPRGLFQHSRCSSKSRAEVTKDSVTQNPMRWFRSSKTDYYQDDEIPDFIDYVLWGHEHDQKYDWRVDKRVLIDQPGATVVTSLTNGELEQRRIGMLTIRRKKNELFWRHDKIPLDTSRIFIFRDFVLVKNCHFYSQID